MTRWQWDIPEYFNIAQACIEHSNRQGYANKQAIVVDDDVQGVFSLTYAELAAQVKAFADRIKRGITEKGDRILIQLPNCLAYPVGFLGALYAGRIAVPASMMLTQEELIYLLNDSGARVAVLSRELMPHLAKMAEACPKLQSVIWVCGMSATSDTFLEYPKVEMTQTRWEEVVRSTDEPLPFEPTKAMDPAYLVYTSGTTGYPKGLLHAHRALLGRMPASRYWFHFEGESDRILHSGKFNWTYVLGTALMDPLSQGKTVIVYEGNPHAELWPKLIVRHQCTIFIGVPTLFRQLLQKTPACGEDVPSLRHCMSAGEHLSDEVMMLWKKRFGLDIYEAVGMSECSYYLSHHVGIPIRPGAAGMPQPGHDIVLMSEDMRRVTIGEEGMICIPLTDPGLFLEYWQLPEETLMTRKQGYFLTGDYARVDEDGYYWFLGRRDDLINSFGYRVSPVEVERILKSHPYVADCAVVGEKVEKDKVLITACVILHEEARISAEALIEFAAQHLAKYKLPKKIRFMETFPRTKNGKVLRRALVSSQ